MSHFTVLVIGDNPEAQLEPYNENTSVPEYRAGEVDEAAMDDFVAYYKKEKGATGTFEEIYKMHGENWNSGRWRKHADGSWHEYSTYNRERVSVDICCGICYNPSNPEMIGGRNGPRSEMDSPRGDETLPGVREGQTIGGILPSNPEPRREVHVLSRVPEAEKQHADPTNAQKMGAETAVRYGPEGVLCPAASAGGCVRHLSAAPEAEMAISGSRSCDWESTRTLVRELQLNPRSSERQLRYIGCGNIVPHSAHIVKEVIVAGAKWDWYSIGGRWKGFFKLKKGAEGELGESGVFGNKPKYDADQCKVKDIDFAGMRKKARSAAKKQYKAFYKALGDHLMPPKFSEFRDKECDGDPNLARQRYHELPAIKALNAAGMHLFFDDYIDVYGCSEEEFCRREEDCVAVPFAVVKDGEWYEKGKMGWFGMAHDEMSQEIWNKKVQEMYQNLDPETLVTLFDCHI